MKRLHFLVEGPTEREFVREVLAPHLLNFEKLCDARLVTSRRDWSTGQFYKGGIASYDKIRHEIGLAIKEDHAPDSFFTTMLDYYGLPTSFPGLGVCVSAQGAKATVAGIESAFLADVAREFSSLPVNQFFIPNIMCHEFETLIFADPLKLSNYYIEQSNHVQALVSQLSQFGDPELVNTSPDKAPSKRILSVIPEYDKVTAGPLIALEIGLPTLRARCGRFDGWITRLERL